MKLKRYGWGIVDKDGNPWWAEDCVCEDREPMEGHLAALNDEDFPHPLQPYHVVQLFYKVKK